MKTTDPGSAARRLASAGRRRMCIGALAAATALTAPGAGAAGPCMPGDWPLWQAFVAHFVQADGRVIDASTPQKHSSSEAQSYAMLFALLANDQPRFALLWRWSLANLFGGTVEGRLPAWLWGLAPDGGWRVLDQNSASDADLWFVYALAEAARLWNLPGHAREARALLATVESVEVSEVPGFGTMLRPGAEGFLQEGGRRWQFNPSYLPLPVLRRLATLSPRGPWSRIASNSDAMLRHITGPHGLAPDWTTYGADAQGGWTFTATPGKGTTGSYDAIRTYLWAGMTSPADPLAASTLQSLRGLAAILARTGTLPESVDTATGTARGAAPFGFHAALLPYLESAGAPAALVQAQKLHVAQALEGVVGRPADGLAQQPSYYDVVLSLFGQGWADRRYRFSRTGELLPRWTIACRTSTS